MADSPYSLQWAVTGVKVSLSGIENAVFPSSQCQQTQSYQYTDFMDYTRIERLPPQKQLPVSLRQHNLLISLGLHTRVQPETFYSLGYIHLNI